MLKDIVSNSGKTHNEDLVMLTEEINGLQLDLQEEKIKLDTLSNITKSLDGLIEEGNVENTKFVMLSAGLEELTEGYEENTVSKFLSRVWKAIKLVVKKIWDFLSELVSRIVRFVKDLFTRKKTTSQALKDLVAKPTSGYESYGSGDIPPEKRYKIAKSLQGVELLNGTISGKGLVSYLKDKSDFLLDVDLNKLTKPLSVLLDTLETTIDNLGVDTNDVCLAIDKEYNVSSDFELNKKFVPEKVNGFNDIVIYPGETKVKYLKIKNVTGNFTGKTIECRDVTLQNSDLVKIAERIKPLSPKSILDIADLLDKNEKTVLKEIERSERDISEANLLGKLVQERIEDLVSDEFDKKGYNEERGEYLRNIRTASTLYSELVSEAITNVLMAKLNMCKDLLRSNVVYYARESLAHS